MTDTIKIRVKSSNGSVLLDLQSYSTIEELIDIIIEKLNITYEFDILIGFPPKIIEYDLSNVITSIISSNDTIVIQSKTLSGGQAHSPNKSSIKPNINSTKSMNKPISFGANIATLHTKTSNKTSRSEKLNKPNKRSKSSTGGSAMDISERLVTSVSGGRSSIDKELRDDFRKAMDLRVEDSLAIARLSSVYAQTFEITEVIEFESVINSAEPTTLSVTFPKGHGNRSDITEEHEIIPKTMIKDVLIAALTDPAGLGREILKPYNLARLSPRMFWSIIKHYGHDIHAALAELFPSIKDWTWIDDRKRELSEKALENKRQKEERDAIKAAKAISRSNNSDS